MANHTLGTIRGTIEIDYDGAGIVKAVRDTENAKKSLGGLDGASSKVLSAFGSFGKGAAKVGAAVNLVTNGVNALVGIVTTLAPVLAAGFAVAPAVILSFASALVIAKVAVSGVGDALSAAAEGGAKFDEALKKLSPNAQAFVKAVQQSLPALQGMRSSIQDAFFKGTAPAIAGIIARIVSLKAQATGVAFALGQIAQNVIKTATNAVNIEKLRTVLSGVNAFLLQIRTALGPLITGFFNLAAQASGFGGTLGGAVAGAIAKFAIWLNKIDLASLFAKAMPIIQELVGLFTNLGTIVAKVFSIFVSDGGGAVGTLTTLAAALANFLKSAQGAAVLDAIRTAMAAISGAVGQVFLALLQALAPALIALAPAVTQLANQLAAVLVPAINALAPLLLQLSQFLSANMSWLGPVAGAVLALAGAYKVYAAAADIVGKVQDVLKSKIVTTTAAWIANTASVVAAKVAQLASAAVTGGAAVAAWIANTAAVVANRVATVAGTVAMVAVRAATVAWTAVQWALNAALDANPIGLIIALVVALVAAIIWLWKNNETFRTVVLAVWHAVQAAIKAVVDWIVNTAWPWIVKAWDAIVAATKNLWNQIKSIWNSIKNFLSAVWNGIKAVASAVWNAIVAGIKAYINLYKSIITAGINAAKNVWTNVLNGIRTVARAVWSAIVSYIRTQINAVKTVVAGVKVVVTTIRNAFNNAKNAASTALKNLVSLVRGLPGRVTGALGNLGRLLYSKGRSLVQGFINGIASMIGAVASKARSVVGAVTKFLPGSPAKEGPLSGKGYVLLRARRFMNDFAQGIEDGSQKPTAALAGAVNPLARAVVPTSLTTKSGSSSAPTPVTPGVGGQRSYMISIGEKVFAELVVDAVTGNPVAVKKAADEGSRRSTWAGSGGRK
jgi:hypothetical protein